MRSQFAVVLIAAALLQGVVWAPARADAAPETLPSDQPSPYAFFDPLVDVQRLILSRFVREPDLRAMQEGAIDGMVEALGDRYTEYLSPSDLEAFNKSVRGEYVGIGASVRMQDGVLTIVTPLDNSPALEAGLLAGDRIVEIAGESTIGLSIDEAIDLLSGEPGTEVGIVVEREGERIEKTVIRRNIQTPTVTGIARRAGNGWSYMLDPSARIGYVRVAQFTGSTMPELEGAIDQLRARGVRGLILDLRFNPGGLLPAATQMADLFLEEGLIVSTKGRTDRDESFYAAPDGTLPDWPVVVLVNRQSASASEVVAGALRDQGRAIVLGERTFGKGSVQTVAPLPSGRGQLKITEQHYYGPSGRIIHRLDDSTEWGVDPSPGFFMPMSDAEYREMIRSRNEREIIRAGEEAMTLPADPDAMREATNDKQLVAALRALRGKLESGEWTPASEATVEDAVQLGELRRLRLARERLLREMERVESRLDALSAAAPPPEEPEYAVALDQPLAGGRVEIYDAEGALVAELEILRDTFARWLIDAPVERIAPEGGADGESGGGDE